MSSIRFMSLLLAVALAAPAHAQTGAVGSVGAPRQPVLGQGGYTNPPVAVSASRDPLLIAAPVRRHLPPRPQANACRRSRPAFGDADFTFHGFDDAGIPC